MPPSPTDRVSIDESIIRQVPLFSELNESERGQILSFCRVKRYKKNAPVFHENDAYAGFFVVLKGSVKVFKYSPEGKEFVMHLLHPYAVIADVPMFEGGRYPANAMALEPTDLLFVPNREFGRAMRTIPTLTDKMLTGFAKKIRSLFQQLESLTLHDVSCRLARYLISRVEDAERENLPRPFIKLGVPKTVVAGQLGTVIETLSRAFKKLQVEHVIEVKGTLITILDYPRLRRLAEYPPIGPPQRS